MIAAAGTVESEAAASAAAAGELVPEVTNSQLKEVCLAQQLGRPMRKSGDP